MVFFFVSHPDCITMFIRPLLETSETTKHTYQYTEGSETRPEVRSQLRHWDWKWDRTEGRDKRKGRKGSRGGRRKAKKGSREGIKKGVLSIVGKGSGISGLIRSLKKEDSRLGNNNKKTQAKINTEYSSIEVGKGASKTFPKDCEK